MDEFNNNNNNGENNYSSGPQNTENQYSAGGYGGNSYGTYSYSPTPVAVNTRKKGHSTGVVILSALLAAIIGASAGVTGILSYVKFNNSVVEETERQGTTEITKKNVTISVDSDAVNVAEAVYEKAGPSVVGIRTTTSVRGFFGGTQESSGSGSGVIYSEDGYIITNYHVIEDVVKSTTAAKIEVFIGSQDSDAYEASVIGYNISSDLALIKINAKNLTPIEFADSDKLKAGQSAVIIGAPGGLEFMGSVTYGVISGLNRVVSADSKVPLIQTDAAINPGNSGGALLDVNGKLIGINSSKIVAEEYESMGFAIPSNVVSEVIKRIISKQGEPEPYIGITVSEKYTAQILNFYGYPAGAVVLSVYENSPADEAGIKRGDIITEFDGKQITEYDLLDDYLKDCEPGQKVSMKVYRSGQTFSVQITVAANSSSR